MTSAASLEHLREIPVSRATVFSGRLLTLHRDEVRLPGGRTASREVVDHPGAVAVVATAPDGRVVLVRQWRHAAGRALWEIPAGTREPGEETARTAERELREETGYTASSWRSLGTMPISPGYTSELISFYAAAGLTGGEPATDMDENVDTALFRIEETARMAATGDLDVKSIAGLALAGMFGAPPRA